MSTKQKLVKVLSLIEFVVSDSPPGYPNLAAFLDSDEGFMIHRRFGFLQSRLLLEKQEELRDLEKKLEKMDKKEAKDDERWPRTIKPAAILRESRTKLLTQIEEKFCSYGTFDLL